MEPIRFSDVVRATGGEPAGPVDGDPLIPAITTDSRHVPPGALFVPIRGKRHDAHEFVEKAFLNGAGFSLAAWDAAFARTIESEQILCPRQKQDEVHVRVVQVIGNFDAAGF